MVVTIPDRKDWCSVIWNNKDIKINGKPVFYKTFFDFGIYSVNDLLFNLSNIESYNVINKETKEKLIFLRGLDLDMRYHSV